MRFFTCYKSEQSLSPFISTYDILSDFPSFWSGKISCDCVLPAQFPVFIWRTIRTCVYHNAKNCGQRMVITDVRLMQFTALVLLGQFEQNDFFPRSEPRVQSLEVLNYSIEIPIWVLTSPNECEQVDCMFKNIGPLLPCQYWEKFTQIRYIYLLPL
jgi:hypothetical protein